MNCQSCQSKEPIYEAGCPGCEARAVKCLKEGEGMIEVEERPEIDVNQALNDLLRQWHGHCLGYSMGKGYPSIDSACRYSRTSRQYDYENGAMDAAVDSKIMEAFDAVIWTLPNTDKQPYLTALQFQARNFNSRAQVWKSPRLPSDEIERGVILMEARNMLMRALARSGVMS